jgi:hypothetical protein
VTQNISQPHKEPATVVEQPRARSVEERVTALEAVTAKSVGPQGIQGPTGPRGGAGNIDAAVSQSKLAFEAAIKAHGVAAAIREDGFRNEIKALRREQAEFKNHLSEYIQTYVDSAVVKVLEDYGVRDHNGNKITVS